MSDAVSQETPSGREAPVAGGETPPAEELVHLHVHTEYSLLDGAIRIDELIERVKFLGHKAVAVTDHGNLFSAIEVYTKCKSAGIKAILGSEIWHSGLPESQAVLKTAAPSSAPPAATQGLLPFHLVLLAKDEGGYKRLIKVVSDGYLRGEAPASGMPIVPDALLEPQGQEPGTEGTGLIAMSSCLKGEFASLVGELRRLVGPGPELPLAPPEGHPAAPVAAALAAHVTAMTRRFGKGNYYVELINNNLPEQRRALPDLVEAARHHGLPLVATADAHYLTAESAEAHAVLIGIKHGLTMAKLRGRRKNARFHVFDNAEMRKVYGAWPDALANQKKIADQCNVSFKFGKYFLPKFELATGESQEEAMARLAREGLDERFVKLRVLHGEKFTDAVVEKYKKRLEYEIDVINKMGFAGYFLIVQDFINWAKQHGIPVGPGRGSGAGSLVAYALRIIDLDPIPYNLLFERFLNPERVSMPDFDVDFCQDRRDEVIKYVTDRYGAARVAQITTFGTMNAKAVVRDVGRVLDLGYGRIDRFARLIPDVLNISLEDAIRDEPRINEELARDESLADLMRLARQLEGLTRHCSVHPAGVVISEGPITDYVPVYSVPGEPGIITQFEMKMAEKVGLVKFDFLGLKTLTVMEKCIELVRASKTPDFDLALIPLGDKSVYQLISAGHSTGVFQLESSGMRQLIMKLKPSCFEDMIALVALFRPGPLGSGMVDDFVERKHGRQKIVYPLPKLEPILKDTYGVILYQEQVMEVSRALASYSLGEADLLRRAMGKKNPEEMAKQKSRFMQGAAAQQIDEEVAGEIFDLMAKFAEYGFNKSHSAAYGLISYQTAYLKTHYPDEFMAAIMTCDLDNTKKIVRYVDECRRMRIKVLPPDINRSRLEFKVVEKGVIDFGLAAIKGVGATAAAPILAARDGADGKARPFTSLADLARRVDLHHAVGKKTLELLAQAGALDGFGIARPKLLEVIPEVVALSEELHTAKKSGQRGLFDLDEEGGGDGGGAQSPAETTSELAWELSVADRKPGAPDPEWLKKEKQLLGVFLTGHPLEFHREDCRAFGRVGTANIDAAVGKRVTMVAVLAMVNERLTKNNTRMASVRLEDQHGAIEAVMFQQEMPAEFPEAGSVVVVTGQVDAGWGDNPTIRFKLERIVGIEEVRQEHVKRAALRLRPPGGWTTRPADYEAGVARLKAHLEAHKGDTPLKVVIDYGRAQVVVDLPDAPIDMADGFLHGLGRLAFESADISYQLFP